MFYQNTFQAEEQPSQSHISCCSYTSEAQSFYPLHCHAYYEISYVIKGSRIESYNGNIYQVAEDSLFFLPPLVVHSNKNLTETTDLVLQFSADFLCNTAGSFQQNMQLLPCNSELPYCIIPANSPQREILQKLYNQSCCEVKSSPLQEFTRSSLILSLLSLLLQENVLILRENASNACQIAALDNVINHLLGHPQENTDMHQASRMAGMSYYNFSRIFKQSTGFHYGEYRNLLRIRYAEGLLVNTSLSIAEIASSIGIDTASYFTRLFKKSNGISPLAYRQRYEKIKK